MKFSNQILSNLLLAGALLAVPAMAAGQGNAVTVSGVQNKQIAQASTTTVEAKGFHKGSCAGRSGREGFKKGMSLSDDQLEKFATLKSQLTVSVAPEKAEAKALKTQLKLALSQPTIDKDQVLGLQSKINADRADIANKVLSSRIDMMNVLTADQKAKLRHRMLIGTAFGGFQHRGFHGKGGRGQQFRGHEFHRQGAVG